MALNPVDRKVLNTAFGMSSAANEPLSPDAVRSKLGGINEEDFYVSLEIMEGDGLMKRVASSRGDHPTFGLPPAVSLYCWTRWPEACHSSGS
jgi:hypothetical protein